MDRDKIKIDGTQIILSLFEKYKNKPWILSSSEIENNKSSWFSGKWGEHGFSLYRHKFGLKSGITINEFDEMFFLVDAERSVHRKFETLEGVRDIFHIHNSTSIKINYWNNCYLTMTEPEIQFLQEFLNIFSLKVDEQIEYIKNQEKSEKEKESEKESEKEKQRIQAVVELNEVLAKGEFPKTFFAEFGTEDRFTKESFIKSRRWIKLLGRGGVTSEIEHQNFYNDVDSFDFLLRFLAKFKDKELQSVELIFDFRAYCGNQEQIEEEKLLLFLQLLPQKQREEFESSFVWRDFRKSKMDLCSKLKFSRNLVFLLDSGDLINLDLYSYKSVDDGTYGYRTYENGSMYLCSALISSFQLRELVKANSVEYRISSLNEPFLESSIPYDSLMYLKCFYASAIDNSFQSDELKGFIRNQMNQ